MSDLTDLLAETGPITREVTIDGKTATVYFRRITAGEQEQILKGQKVQHSGGKASIELDLCENEKQRHQLVFFSVCKQDGSRFFKKLDDVKALPSLKVRALSEHAMAVNAEEDDAGKA